jgi:FAD/FMN-containing dehydrogenase
MATVTVRELDTTALAERVRGELIGPHDAGYEEARSLYNSMIDKHPALIVRCVDVADVMAAVDFARDTGTPVAVRGGAHNPAGFAGVDDGVVICAPTTGGSRVPPGT